MTETEAVIAKIAAERDAGRCSVAALAGSPLTDTERTLARMRDIAYFHGVVVVSERFPTTGIRVSMPPSNPDTIELSMEVGGKTLTFSEPYNVFPSETLLAQLALVVG